MNYLATQNSFRIKCMRPKKEINPEQLSKFMEFKHSLEETADFFNVSPDTIERRIREWFNCTFAEFRHKKGYKLRRRLIERAVELAMNGNATLMIFCLKNIAGWGDKPEPDAEEITDMIF